MDPTQVISAAGVLQPPKQIFDAFTKYMLDGRRGGRSQQYVSMQLAADFGHAKAGETIKLTLSPDDLRISEEMDTFVAGVHSFGFRADEVSPVILVDNPRFKFRRFSKNNIYKKVNVESSWQAAVPEVDPETDLVDAVVIPRAIGSFLPAVIESITASFDPRQAASRRIRAALDLDREVRVWTLLSTSGSWDAANRVTLGAGLNWNGGVSSNPIIDIQTRLQASTAPVTGIWMNETVKNVFLRHPAVRDYMKALLGDSPATGIGDATTDFRIPGLPPIHVVPGKVLNETTSALDDILNDTVVLVSSPRGGTPIEQVQTIASFRLRGPSGTGFTSREFFEDRRGLDGGTMLVQGHAEVVAMISNTAGGAIFDVIQ